MRVSAPRKELCVAVVGMHRSGTSATAGLLVKLGLTAPRPGDLIGAQSSNESGLWESRAVVNLNTRLLQMVGTKSFAPPEPVSQWDQVPGYETARETGSRWYAATSTGDPVVMKDPRTSLTLPFWRAAIPVPMAAVLVFRHPLEVARSLEARNHLPVTLGLAMWDRYLRTVAEVGLIGMPTLVVEYDRMLANPEQGVDEIVRFLGTLGVEISPTVAESARKSLDSTLRHQKAEADDYSDLARVQEQMFLDFSQLVGIHERWEAPFSLPAAPLWVDDIIRLRREVGNRRRELRLLHKSWPNRVAFAVKRATGRSSRASEAFSGADE